jgi:four helix bundle protein
MSYKEQFIWKRSVELSVKCYEITRTFPQSEVHGLFNQIRRASVSVASNIDEGYGRQSKAEYIRFLHIALGSLRELDTQLLIAHKVGLASDQKCLTLIQDVEDMQKILVATLNKLKARS